MDSYFFFFNDTATTEIYTLSLHDALPICHLHVALGPARGQQLGDGGVPVAGQDPLGAVQRDRKSTRLNSSHSQISYAVFCLKKKKKSQLHSLLTINNAPLSVSRHTALRSV